MYRILRSQQAAEKRAEATSEALGNVCGITLLRKGLYAQHSRKLFFSGLLGMGYRAGFVAAIECFSPALPAGFLA
jgi:hypothetical protein